MEERVSHCSLETVHWKLWVYLRRAVLGSIVECSYLTNNERWGTLPRMLLYTVTTDPVEADSTLPVLFRRPQWLGLAIILLLYLVVATAYLLVVPPLEGFDALAHMNAVNYWRQEQAPPTIDLATNQYSYELLTQPPLYYMLSALTTAWIPAEGADVEVRASANRYFPGLSKRQSIELPGIPPSVEQAMLLARLVSLLGGIVTVGATWLWVRTVLPHQPWLPSAVAAVVAFNPLFLFSSTSITNDAWAAAGTVVVIWLVSATAARSQGKTQRSLWRWLLVGVVAGLAALTKYSVLLVAVPALAILIQYRCYRPLGRFVAIAAALLGGALLTAGWWYGRNLLLYGQPVPLATISSVITTLQRTELMPLAQVWELLPFLFYSYWGLFLATFAPDRFFQVIQWAILVALIGLPLWLLRQRQRRLLTAYSPTLWLALLWFVLTLVSMINYMRLISYGEQARFLLPAAPAIALWLVTSWQAWLPVRFAHKLRPLVVLFMLVLALWPLSTLHRAYAHPPLLPTTATTRPIEAHFADGPRLVGYDLPQGAALTPGSSLPLVLYFTADQPIAGDYTLFLHLADQDDRLLYQHDGVPFSGRHPTRQWQPGQLFADGYQLTVPTVVPTDTLATLIVGFYAYEEPTKRLPVYASDGTLLGDRLVLGQIRLQTNDAPVIAPDTQPLASWAAGIDLMQAAVEPADVAGYHVQLQWRTTALLTTDYTVFLQFLDANGAVVAQIDQQPQAGAAPTSTWLRNEHIADIYQITPPATWRNLVIGLYNAQSGQRLPLIAPTPTTDYFMLQQR